MHQLCAFYESIANDSVYADLNGVIDQSMTLDSNNRFVIPAPWKVIAAYVGGINLTAARLTSPSLMAMYQPQVYPTNDTADVPALDAIMNVGARGYQLVTNESFCVQVSRGGADAQPVLAGVWLAPDIKPAVAGPIYTARASASVTIVAGSWVLASLTFESFLPAGEYELVGAAVICNDASLARFVFTGGNQVRPGVLVNDAYGDLTLMDPFRFGRFGSFGRFQHNLPPNIEILGDTAGAETAVVLMDLVKVR